MKREFTQDVHFFQCSVGMVFFWRGNTFVKKEKGVAEQRTNDHGQQLQGPGEHKRFDDMEMVIVSNQDESLLRFDRSGSRLMK